MQAVSYVSRRRLDADDFDADAVDEEGTLLMAVAARSAAGSLFGYAAVHFGQWLCWQTAHQL